MKHEVDGLEGLRKEAAGCRACPLYRDATQTVFGEGPGDARLVFVGEQPGDQEDVEGRPFIGPAGRLLAEAFEEAGIRREDVYVTNAVKHFKFVQRGKRRLHEKPSEAEVRACRPWLEGELRAIQPAVLVCLGATAAQSIIGAHVRVLRDRGRVMASSFCEWTFVTVHPSALLRMPDAKAREAARAQFVGDLVSAAAFARGRGGREAVEGRSVA
ncbi:MAG: UdgX family uracil-DNA binding protein [Terrimicrobiaceae bacterium]|nr:UdgX family uracil-DNA binding protein [Terrimicrobiaceae bacterium]